MWHSANLGPLLLFKKPFFGTNHPLVLHSRISNEFPLSQSDNVCGELRSDIFASVAFELAPLKRLMWMQSDGMREMSAKGAGVFHPPRTLFVSSSDRGGVRGLQGSFSIKDRVRLKPLPCPPWEIQTDFKGVGGNSLNRVLYLGLRPFKCWHNIHTTHARGHTRDSVTPVPTPEFSRTSVYDKQSSR